MRPKNISSLCLLLILSLSCGATKVNATEDKTIPSLSSENEPTSEINSQATDVSEMIDSKLEQTKKDTARKERPKASSLEPTFEFDLNKMMMEAAKAAAKESAINYIVEHLLTKTLDYTPALVAQLNAIHSDGSLTPAAKLLAIYSALKGTERFIDAKTDKERLFAAADIGVSYLMVKLPPAGAVAALALLAVKVTDQILDAQSQAKIIEIQARILELQKAILQDQTRIYRSKIIPHVFESYLLTALVEAAKGSTVDSRQMCQFASATDSLAALFVCYQSLHQTNRLYQLISFLSERLSISAFENSVLLGAMATQNGPESFKALATYFKGQSGQIKSGLRNLEQETQKLSTVSERSPFHLELSQARMNCQEQVQLIQYEIQILLTYRHIEPSRSQSDLKKLRYYEELAKLKSLERKLLELSFTVCADYTDVITRSSPYEGYLFQVLYHQIQDLKQTLTNNIFQVENQLEILTTKETP